MNQNSVFCNCPDVVCTPFMHEHGALVCRSCGRVTAGQHPSQVLKFILNESQAKAKEASEAIAEAQKKVEKLSETTREYTALMRALDKIS